MNKIDEIILDFFKGKNKSEKTKEYDNMDVKFVCKVCGKILEKPDLEHLKEHPPIQYFDVLPDVKWPE